MNPRRFGILAGISGAVLALSAATAASETTWRMASAYPESVFHTQNIKQFIAEVEEKTEGALKIRLHDNSSLYAMPQIKQAVETGQVPIAEFMPSAYGNEDQLFEVDVIPYLAAGYEQAWELYQATKPLLEEKLEQGGLKLLYSVAWPGGGFYSATAIDAPADLKGRKMRAAAPITGKWTDRLGMTSHVIQLPELAQAFSTGMVDMMFTSSPMAPTIQAWEFTDYFYDIEAIHGKNVVVVNQRAFDSLAPDVQAALVEAAANAEKRGWELSRTADQGYKDEMARGGMQVIDVAPEVEAVLRAEAEPLQAEWMGTLDPRVREAIESVGNQ